jgi:hypothetical protein
MEWTIINTPNDNLIKIRIQVVPENEAIEYFFSGISLRRFPVFLSTVVNSHGFHNEVSGIITFADLDGGDFASGRGFKKDHVKIYHNVFNSETVIPESIYCKMVLDYTTMLLKVYRTSTEISPQWVKEIEEGIEQLKEKIREEK